MYLGRCCKTGETVLIKVKASERSINEARVLSYVNRKKFKHAPLLHGLLPMNEERKLGLVCQPIIDEEPLKYGTST